MSKKLLVVAIVAFLGLTSVVSAGADKITLCHVTGSESNPVVEITVAMKALATHLAHGDFLIPVGDVDCFGNGGGPLPE
jgi:TRAP-type C4-dicarboxylate transport system substrate-binding protein